MNQENRVFFHRAKVKKEPILSPYKKLLYTLIIVVFIAMVTRYFIWWIQPQHIPTNWYNSPLHIIDIILFSLLTFVVFIGSLASTAVWFPFWFSSRPNYLIPPKGFRVAFLTCFVPGKEPISMLKKTLNAIKNVRYPHDTWVLDEGNSREVKDICGKIGAYHFSRKGRRRFNHGIFRTRTKAGNHNAWRHHYEHNYDIVAQIDMDHLTGRITLTSNSAGVTDFLKYFLYTPRNLSGS